MVGMPPDAESMAALASPINMLPSGCSSASFSLFSSRTSCLCSFSFSAAAAALWALRSEYTDWMLMVLAIMASYESPVSSASTSP
jgi:hypothetical protein